MKLIRNNLFLILLVTSFLIFSLYYLHIQKNKEFSYWDESSCWVCNSYFFDYFLKFKFSSNVWETYFSYDQPKLAQYLYGAVLYPKYLYEKYLTGEEYKNYTIFLLSKGFYCIDERFTDEYVKYKNPRLLAGELSLLGREQAYGTKETLIARYGEYIIGHLDAIAFARNVNSFLLPLAVLVFGYLVYKINGIFISLVFIFVYGFNRNVINQSLYAHSEALFLLLFNASILFIYLYFVSKKKKFFLLSSLSTGLCMSTKLNGLMPFLLYTVLGSINLIALLGLTKLTFNKFVRDCVIYLTLSLSVFVILNPFVWIKPYERIVFMFNHRLETAKIQQQVYSETTLPTYNSRLISIYNHFFKNGEFSEINYRLGNAKIWLVLFILGIISVIKKHKAKTIDYWFLPISFALILGITVYYLYLDWPRYYVHLTPFFIYFEVLGLLYIFNTLKSLKTLTVKK